MTDPKGSPETGYLPVQYPEEQPYWDGLRAGELRLQKCHDCGKVRYPVGPVCSRCLSSRAAWAVMSGLGTVSTYVVFWKAWAPWLQSRAPYVVAQVELPEGPRLTTNLLGIEPADVRVGLDVTAVYERRAEDIVLLQFEPRQPAGVSAAAGADGAGAGG
ncbi:MAG TPA: OB-fold domain-containing protein [Streptosporangiaceae bacterium]|jgi:hypothetical protein|nr:OB-fold domain-containing protein [Streptosporangiaceae bacterium]